MAVKQRRNKKSNAAAVVKDAPDSNAAATAPLVIKPILFEDHLPPLPLVFTVLFCSGALWVLGLRDFLATGKNFLGDMDDAYLEFTKSTQWFADAKGWKSTQGGLSAVQGRTTDENNMGGLFVRKLVGAATIAIHLHKLLPILFHPKGAQWKHGHFRPLLATSVLANLSIATLYGVYMEDFSVAGADLVPTIIMALLGLETLVMLTYLIRQTKTTRGPSVIMPEGKIPTSTVNRICARTVLVVSGVMTLIAGRDVFMSGSVIPFIPRDDIYLEWTGAFLHSPPHGSVEAAEHGLDAPFYVGDKFISQLAGVSILVLCLYKFVSSCMIQYGSDGSGWIKSKMFWRTSSVTGALIVFCFRLFHAPALSASLDIRWHLMMLSYEAFILGLYAFM
eukprot:CAMPEP_0119005578 /NCGR_PEP_ID=MMETSP1176-20130426/1808_1 /TAXON_ID=265551 /ORGANISM="Synedropsis recta cf, Strain CCMP1620" /LENGTH=390 /DNA_ID=CAMNT_0006957409 /DNA_START=57 /DNA_END=1229 /DNA_ORIENTATION=+